MNDHTTKTEGLSEHEQELLTYYRSLTAFNQRRVFTIARNAYDDVQRANMFRQNNSTRATKGDRTPSQRAGLTAGCHPPQPIGDILGPPFPPEKRLQQGVASGDRIGSSAENVLDNL